MLILARGNHQGLQVGPRWPSSNVLLDRQVFQQLLEVQSSLPDSVRLLVTRGYENKGSRLGVFRTLSRWLGIKLFVWCYPGRQDEVEDIFGSNGHDVDGTHVDVSIIFNARRLRFLPLGVFTPPSRQGLLKARHGALVDEVKAALVHCGFQIHRNHTESLQIHCDYRPGLLAGH
ncbi:hypothetical protein [Pseudomonas sp. ABAC61]|nr:hypothetical protein AO265_30260 [Pseudomonas sp. ABAC61]